MEDFGIEKRVQSQSKENLISIFVIAVVGLFLIHWSAVVKANTNELQSVNRLDSDTVEVHVSAMGETENAAREQAMRMALQAAVEQFIVVDRVIEGSSVTKDEIISTYNGFIERFRTAKREILKDGHFSIDAVVHVSLSSIENYVGLNDTESTRVDGSSLFAEAARKSEHAKSLSKMLDRYFINYPRSAFDVQLDSVEPVRDGTMIEIHFTINSNGHFVNSLREFVSTVAAREFRGSENETSMDPGTTLCLKGVDESDSFGAKKEKKFLGGLITMTTGDRNRRSRSEYGLGPTYPCYYVEAASMAANLKSLAFHHTTPAVLFGFLNETGELVDHNFEEAAAPVNCYLLPVVQTAYPGKTYRQTPNMLLKFEEELRNSYTTYVQLDQNVREARLTMSSSGLDLGNISHFVGAVVGVSREELPLQHQHEADNWAVISNPGLASKVSSDAGIIALSNAQQSSICDVLTSDS